MFKILRAMRLRKVLVGKKGGLRVINYYYFILTLVSPLGANTICLEFSKILPFNSLTVRSFG